MSDFTKIEPTFELRNQGGCQAGLCLIRSRWRDREQKRKSPIRPADIQARGEQTASIYDNLSPGLKPSKHPLYGAREL